MAPHRRPKQSFTKALTLVTRQNVKAREQEDICILLYRKGMADNLAVLGRHKE